MKRWQKPVFGALLWGHGAHVIPALTVRSGWAHGVTANVLVPGFVPTPLNVRLSAEPATVAALAARTLVGRNGTPEDFAAAAVFLAAPGSGYVTGQTIPVDGGFSVH